MQKDVHLDVVFYRTATGKEPVREWLSALSKQDKKVLGGDIKTVQYGWPLGMPVVKKLEKDLWEIRSQLDRRIARILFTVSGSRLVLLHGFIKKTRQTPREDLQLARHRKAKLVKMK